MVKRTLPLSRMPTWSCGCECSSTTEFGSRSTTDSIRRSVALVWMWTPGKMVCRAHSSGVGKNRLMVTPERRKAHPARRVGLKDRTDRSAERSLEHVVHLGTLLDLERHQRLTEGDGATSLVDRPGLRLDALDHLNQRGHRLHDHQLGVQ